LLHICYKSQNLQSLLVSDSITFPFLFRKGKMSCTFPKYIFSLVVGHVRRLCFDRLVSNEALARWMLLLSCLIFLLHRLAPNFASSVLFFALLVTDIKRGKLIIPLLQPSRIYCLNYIKTETKIWGNLFEIVNKLLTQHNNDGLQLLGCKCYVHFLF
jgi:hypothetical protein